MPHVRLQTSSRLEKENEVYIFQHDCIIIIIIKLIKVRKIRTGITRWKSQNEREREREGKGGRERDL